MKLVNVKILGTALITLSVSSCGFFGGDKRPVYQGAEYYKNLEIPPNLTAPETVDALKVPKPTDSALQRYSDDNKSGTGTDTKIGAVIAPTFDGVRVVNNAGNSWLEIGQQCRSRLVTITSVLADRRYRASRTAPTAWFYGN